MKLQQYHSTLPCLPLPSGNLQTPFPSILLCYRPISSSVILLSLSPAELSSPCQRILRCGHTILSFCFFTMVRRSSCTPIALWILLRTSLFVKCSEVSYCISSQGLGSFSRFLLSRSSSHRRKGKWIRLASATA